MSYTKLFSEIVTSSIWSEDDKTRIVWITMLALKDQHGVVSAALPGLANAARVSIDDCARAIAILEAPDIYSRTKDHDGRRVEPCDGGWVVLNHFKYRDGVSGSSDHTAAERMRRYREKKATASTENTENTEKNNTDTDTYTGLRNVTVVTVKDDFQSFWAKYPRKVGKKAALKAWHRASDRPAIDAILSAIDAQMTSEAWKKDGGQFIPHPATWINQGRWDDEVLDESAMASNRTPVAPIVFTADFETLWHNYPKQGRVDKYEAWDAWKAALPRIEEQAEGNIRGWMQTTVNRIAWLESTAAWLKDNGAGIPKLSNWIKRGGWEE